MEGSFLQLSANHIHFFIGYAVAFLAFGLIGKWYVWPAIKDRAPAVALTPLLLYACLRVNGLMFLTPGLVSPDLPRAFAIPTAYGDLAATVLALLALAAVRRGSILAAPMIWLFNVVGSLDLAYANVSTLQGQRGSGAARRLVLSGGAQRAGHAGHSRRYFYLSVAPTPGGLRDIIGVLTDTGLDPIESGQVGTMELHFVFAAAQSQA
jgi:hypothetical protein